MKKITILLFFMYTLPHILGQTNEEIAGVYLNKATQNLTDNKLIIAEKNFNKALVLLNNDVKQESTDRLGTLINYLQGKFDNAKKFAKHYFTIAQDKTTEEYNNQLELFVEIEEKIDSIDTVNAEIERKKLAHLKELDRVASLKNDWNELSNQFSFKAQKISVFNKYGIAIIKQNNFYGIVNDKASLVIKPNRYKDFRFFDEYILLLDEIKNTTEILCYNTATKESFKVPNVSTFNKISTTYGVITQPRGNDKLVMYPNNTTHTLIFDLKTKKINTITDYKSVLKPLKSNDVIDSFNKKEQIKVNKQWYYFGGDIGGGVYTIYGEDLSLYGYLLHTNGNILTKKEVGYLGALYRNTLESSKMGWIDIQKSKVKTPINEVDTYHGTTSINKLESGNYQFKNKDIIIFKKETLAPLKEYLLKNNVAKEYL